MSPYSSTCPILSGLGELLGSRVLFGTGGGGVVFPTMTCTLPSMTESCPVVSPRLCGLHPRGERYGGEGTDYVPGRADAPTPEDEEQDGEVQTV